MILSEDQIAEIEARHAAATRGTWMGGPEAEAAGRLYPDWGHVYAHTPDADHPFPLIFDGCWNGVASEEEKSACRAKSIELRRAGAECDWTEPAQVAANRRFIEAAHNTDIPALVASHRLLAAHAKRLADQLDETTARLVGEIAGVEAERDALSLQVARLKEVVRHAIAMRSVVHDTDLCGLELEIAEQKHKDALDEAIDALPAYLKELASLSSPTGGDR
ncbi:hypothetical protein D9623_33495 (plasmid) [Azospirillum brasilense]|uniref:Ead/Ea22-like family protein n=1 Tax=Azospirillum brasilense TaxID=192 RepID=A0A4D8QUN4_AZOBR|nr:MULTISPECIES: hypothetical protein [Azospirillum]YP_001686900.1 hypothetical protein APCd_gp59 [Azospirillum phage Cd]MDW7555353.1 hypothetical protein [Azospirillum brasilense]MDW7595239.1 hypothetical protein [Azospirillum brasilense]MDW7630393.1 hypothetical protein [Azospirillum brasilense]MDX5949760.1 hypothetical protein [Azospirillum brasilense]OPH16887.1 hypothetical protein FE89_02720 [Azospirillum brasilense]